MYRPGGGPRLGTGCSGVIVRPPTPGLLSPPGTQAVPSASSLCGDACRSCVEVTDVAPEPAPEHLRRDASCSL